MKKKEDLLKEAADYFKKYPQDNEVYTTGDGNFFVGTRSRSNAKVHAANQKKTLITITRDEVEDAAEGEDDAPVIIPEGEPGKDWTKAQLIAFGAKTFPDLKLSKSMKEETILTKLAEAGKPAE